MSGPTGEDGANKPGGRPLLEGRRLGTRGPVEEALVTYAVLDAPSRAPPAPLARGPAPPARPGKPAGEKRNRPRRRTRLRTGKIVDAAGRFLTECLIYDRSEAGGRLRLPAGTQVPALFQLFEDQNASLWRAEAAWRDGRDIGVRLTPPPADSRTRALEAALRRRFYAVPD